MSEWAHVFGNWKWTGPADLVVSQVRALGDRARLYLGACPFEDQPHFVADQCRARGLRPRITRHLRKHQNPLRLPLAAMELWRMWSDDPPHLVHAHFDADHAAAARACHLLSRRPALVRTLHAMPPHPRRRRRLLEKRSHLVLAPTPALARGAEKSLDWPAGEIGVLEPDVDLQRFQFDEEVRARGRERLGLPAEAFVVGIVARVQRHRLWELLLQAWKRLSREPEPPHLVVFGRGTHFDELLEQPVRECGLEHLVHRPGYQEGEAYREGLAACDAGVFLVPGSDITCRAVREWMAMGRGVACTPRAPLPEFVQHEVDGFVFPEDPDALAQAFRGPERAETWRRRGAAAQRKARSRWSPQRQLENTRMYYRMAEAARPSPTPPPAARALLAVRPGWLPAARFWAEEHAIVPDDLALLNPTTSRDAVLDILRLRAQTGYRRVLLENSGDWDATVLQELQRRFRVQVSLLDPPDAAEEAGLRWLRAQVDEVWVPPADRRLGATDWTAPGEAR